MEAIPQNNKNDKCSEDELSKQTAEILKLKEELKYQRLRADAFDEMINVAEQQFQINIRKKVGAKR